PMVIVIDGLDECRQPEEQTQLLEEILASILQLGPSAKLLISCRPQPHLEHIFNQFNLGDSYRINLGQSAENNDDIRTFLRISFDQIYEKHSDKMSTVAQPWPSHDDIEELVDRASGQFIFAATAISFMD
ncbi:hypothetical protein BDN72DRAFT_736185, partial [Pluteus cervinus]